MQLTAAISTANIAGVRDGEWAVISPYGSHPSPDRSYVQILDRPQAERIVRTWNSITGIAARRFKNLWHGLGMRDTCPVWEGHPEQDKRRWPKEKLLAEVSDIRAGAAGLEGLVTWNAKGMSQRERGPLFPSSLWWHMPPAGDPPTVYPELLESVGLWPQVNIAGVPAWTANTPLPGTSPDETTNPLEAMTPEQLAALRRALDLADSADAAACLTAATTANAAVATLTERDRALSTANAARSTLETQLQTANTSVLTLTGERDTLRTANTTLAGETAALVTGLLDICEKRGAITPAQRDDFKARLTTANTAAAALTELQTRKAMNTERIEINGTRVDLTTANARSQTLQSEIARRMKANGTGYDTEFAAVSADPSFAALFAAMQDPTKAAA